MRLTAVWLWISVGLAVLIGVGSLRYLFLGVAYAPPNIATNAYARSGALVFHGTLASGALILGGFQLWPRLRARWPAWHRRAGTLYVACCLLAGLAGLRLAAGASTGPVSTAGFGLLALLWIGFTANAWRLARARDYIRHRRWMIRSFALTFAAVTLRLYLPVLFIAHLDFGTGYRAIAFLCWVPNLVVAELWLRRDRPGRTSPPLARSARSPG